MQFNTKGGIEVLSKELMEIAKRTDGETLASALDEGSKVIKRSIQQRVSSAKRSSGNLKKSITYRLVRGDFGEKVSESVFGWKRKRVRVTKKTGKGVYTTDYGPVLEFDTKRQLRHLNIGFDDKRGEAENMMKKVFEQKTKI